MEALLTALISPPPVLNTATSPILPLTLAPPSAPLTLPGTSGTSTFAMGSPFPWGTGSVGGRWVSRLWSRVVLSSPVPYPQRASLGYVALPFVHDAFHHPGSRIALPGDRPVHLDFEAGRGEYALGFAADRPDWHVIAIDDGGLSLAVSDGHVTPAESGRFTPERLERHLFQMVRERVWYLGRSRTRRELAHLARDLRLIRRDVERGRLPDEDRYFELWEERAREMIGDRGHHYHGRLIYSQLIWQVVDLAVKYSLSLEGIEPPPQGAHYSKDAAVREAAKVYEPLYDARRLELFGKAEEPRLSNEELFRLGLDSRLYFHFKNYAPNGRPPSNLSVVRAPTAAETGFGFVGLPLPDASVDSITWIGPFRHNDDVAQISAEIRRVLKPQWTSVEIGVYHRDRNDDFNRTALAVVMQTIGAGHALHVVNFKVPLRGGYFDRGARDLAITRLSR